MLTITKSTVSDLKKMRGMLVYISTPLDKDEMLGVIYDTNDYDSVAQDIAADCIQMAFLSVSDGSSDYTDEVSSLITEAIHRLED